MSSRANRVVIVGGGIAGSALGFALASDGLDVTILERSARFTDRVRGELMQAWGVAETKRLGLDAVLVDRASAVSRPLWRRYDGRSDDGVEMAMDRMAEGVSGSMNMGHPVACQALLDAAAEAGANVVREVSRVTVAPGVRPVVTWSVAGENHEAEPDLVVGADGRASTVRKQSRVELEHQDGFSCIAGLLVEGLEEIPDEADMIVSDNDQYMLMFQQTQSRARVYLCGGLSQTRRFAGSAGVDRFLEACGELSFPWAAQLGAGTVAGPCGSVVGDDTWTAAPYVEGVVLIGDAAGFNDPLLGQGLSVAFRDARVVRDLILDGGAGPDGFAAYGRERNARMERLRLAADVLAVVHVEDCDNREARQERFAELLAAGDSTLPLLLLGVFAGPEIVPDDGVDLTLPDVVRGVAVAPST
jgi:menaquinone-9 beta-reductase